MFKKEDFKLRPIEESDLVTILHWRNSERIRSVMLTDHIITMTEHEKWYKKLLNDNSNISNIFEYKGDAVGVININQIDKCNGNCSWGFYLGRENLPHGISIVMGYLSLDYIFQILGIRKLCSKVLSFNKSSIKYHTKLGFTIEGHLIKHVLKNGVFEDIILMALFYNDWLKAKDLLYDLSFCSGD